MSDQDPTARGRLIKSAVFLFVLAVHGALVFMMFSRAALRIPRPDAEGSLVFLLLPAPPALPLSRRVLQPESATLRPRYMPPRGHPAPPAITEKPADETPPLSVDWTAEAERSAEEQARLAADAHHRPLDSHAPGADLEGGLGPYQDKKSDFGWYHARIHRVEKLKGGGSIIWINDRCFIPVVGLAIIPFPFCGIGKIPARGDLFDHMRDPRDLGGNTGPGAP
jgi:hypothetical protein